MLSEVDSREAALANLLAASEVADNLIWLEFWRRSSRTPRGRGRMPGWKSHGCCDAGDWGVLLMIQRPPLLPLGFDLEKDSEC